MSLGVGKVDSTQSEALWAARKSMSGTSGVVSRTTTRSLATRYSSRIPHL